MAGQRYGSLFNIDTSIPLLPVSSNDSGLKYNAPLDLNSITALARGVISSDLTSNIVSQSIAADHFSVFYVIYGALYEISVRIVQYSTPNHARRTMKEFVCCFDTNMNEVARELQWPLGHISMQTDYSVFWVRDCMWLRVSVGHSYPCHTIPTMSTVNVPPINPEDRARVMLNFVTTLDAHLATHSVPAALQLKPNTAVVRSDLIVPVNQRFTM